VDSAPIEVTGAGNGPIAALVDALDRHFGIAVEILGYHEHALAPSADANAVAYVEAAVDDDVVWGVGMHASIVTASLRAILNAVNRARALHRTAAVAAPFAAD
jgi:2-isopropylmalate synthase